MLQIKSIISNYSNPMNSIDFDMRIDSLDEDDLSGVPTLNDGLLLNTYSVKDIQNSFEKFGIMEQLAHRNYKSLHITIDNSDPFVHRVQISSAENPHDVKSSSNNHLLLVDMFIRRKEIYVSEIIQQKQRERESKTQKQNLMPQGVDNRYLPHFIVTGETYEWGDLVNSEKILGLIQFPIKATVIEWLCLQDPNKTFTNQRPPLPGQSMPGLGIGKQLDDVFVNAATKQNRDCLLNSPYRFYNAFMYQSQEYFFMDPAVQGLFQTLLVDMEPYITKFGLSPVSWAFEFGCVREKSSDKIVKWEFHLQTRPISTRMKLYFKSKEYQQCVKENIRPVNTFYINWSGHPSLNHFCSLEVVDNTDNASDQANDQTTSTTKIN